MKPFLAIVAVLLSRIHTVEGAGVANGGNSRKLKGPPKPNPAKAIQALKQARPVIEKLIEKNERLVPLFVRMGFHDCIDVCDGCIDLADPNNFGLKIPIDALRPVVAKFATPETGLSRSDLWAFAATVATDVAPHGTVTEPVNFTMNWIGRVDCEKSNKKCFNAKGKKVACSATAGPHRPTPAVSFNSKQTYDFFAQHFNFTSDDTVAIMGMHNLGHLNKKNSGIDAPSGWILNQTWLQNEYYNALMGAGSFVPDELKIFNAPPWVRAVEKNNGHPFPDRHFWNIIFMGKTFVMLNSDLGLARDFNSENTDPITGAVNCAYNNLTGGPVCPLSDKIGLIVQYALDNTFWLKELKDVWDRMLSNGYVRVACPDTVCPLK